MTNANTPRLAVIYGDTPSRMVPALMDVFDVPARIPAGASVGIKPNLVVSKPSAFGATTDPAVVEAVVRYLRDCGVCDISIMESSWLGDDTELAFDVCGYRAIGERYGVPLVDLKKDGSVRRCAGGLSIDVCRSALDVGYLINLPVLKAHSQTLITCALKNLKGVIPDREKQRFHSLGLHAPIAALSAIVKTDFVIVDGIIGDLSHEEGGHPVAMNRLIAGDDPVGVDAFAADLLGYEVSQIPYIGLAQGLGVGSASVSATTVRILNAAAQAPPMPRSSRLADRFAGRIDAREACSPCLGGLLYALTRLERESALCPLPVVSIGQGFKRERPALGVGNCTRRGARHVRGCPPSAADIVRFLKGVAPR